MSNSTDWPKFLISDITWQPISTLKQLKPKNETAIWIKHRSGALGVAFWCEAFQHWHLLYKNESRYVTRFLVFTHWALKGLNCE